MRDIVLNMHGQDLTALKNAMDDGGDAHNIHKLIYNDILVCSIYCTHTCSCRKCDFGMGHVLYLMHTNTQAD